MQSRELAGKRNRERHRWPKLSVVTPSFNQATHLERTIQSVLDQGYPNLEYMVLDGGSSDGSVAIIEKYAKHLAYWISEPDRGQVHAINKGLRMATGEWVGWQNSDDIYYPDSFAAMADAAAANPEAGAIIGDLMLIDEHGGEVRDVRYVRPTYGALCAEGMVVANQAAFWRRSVHDRIGFLNESLDCVFDYEWFLRLTQHFRVAHVRGIWGGLRRHAQSKTSAKPDQFQEEFQRVRRGRTVYGSLKHLYQMRRMVLMLQQGDFRYVVRGLGRRARGETGP